MKIVTLHIPDHVAAQAQKLAEQQQRPLTEVLTDILLQAFPAVYVHPQRERMLRETAAFEAQLPQLRFKYQREYVAMHQGQVVDHDADQMTLVKRIDNIYGTAVVLIKQVTNQPKRVLRARSPRFTR